MIFSVSRILKLRTSHVLYITIISADKNTLEQRSIGIVGACFPNQPFRDRQVQGSADLGISPKLHNWSIFRHETSATRSWCVSSRMFWKISVSHLRLQQTPWTFFLLLQQCMFKLFFFDDTRITSRQHFFTVTQWGGYSSSHYGLGWPYLESASLSEGSCRCVSESLQGKGIKGSIDIRTLLYLLSRIWTGLGQTIIYFHIHPRCNATFSDHPSNLWYESWWNMEVQGDVMLSRQGRFWCQLIHSLGSHCIQVKSLDSW